MIRYTRFLAVVTLLLLILIVPLLAPTPFASSKRLVQDARAEGPPVVDDPSTLGTSTTSAATPYNSQRKSFYASGLFWTFWGDGVNVVFSTSSDGATWSSKTTVRASYSGGGTRGFSVAFDGTYVHYTYADTSSNHAAYYRRGTPNSNGTITWSAAEQTAMPAISGQAYLYPTIAINSAGYAFIAYSNKNSTHYRPTVTKNANTDGTWSTDTGFPYTLSGGSTAESYALVVALSSTRAYVIYNTGGTVYPSGRLWDGAAFGVEENVGSTYKIGSVIGGSIGSYGDNVYYVWQASTVGYLVFERRTYGLGWDEPHIIRAVSSGYRPSISVDPNNGNAYAFWVNFPTTNHVYYIRYFAALDVWQSTYTDWFTEVAITATNTITAFAQPYEGYIGVQFMNGTATPWQVRFAYLTVPPVAVVSTVSDIFVVDHDNFVNTTIIDSNGAADIQNVTLAFSTNGAAQTFTLMWNQVTDTWSEVSDPSGIVTINAAACLNSTTNANTVVLDFMFKFTTGFTSGPVSVTSTASNSTFSASLTSTSLYNVGTVSRVYINFDDGYTAQYTIAWPIMQEYGITATFYPIYSKVGAPNHMTWTQLSDLVSQGNEVGSHTRNHVHPNALSASQVTDEVVTVKSDFLTHGITALTFAYPYGEGYNNATITDAINSAGYVYARRSTGAVWSRTTGTKTAVNIYSMAYTTYPTMSLATLTGFVNRAYDDTEVGLLIHGIGGTSGYNVTTALFEETMAYLHNKGFTTILNSEVGGVIQPITITASNLHPDATITPSGCRVYPTMISGDGVSHQVSADPSCSLTLTLPADTSTTRYRYTSESLTWDFSSCASGTCSVQTNTYYVEYFFDQNTCADYDDGSGATGKICALDNYLFGSPVVNNAAGVFLNATGVGLPSAFQFQVWNTSDTSRIPILIESSVKPSYILNAKNYTYTSPTLTIYTQLSNQTLTLNFATLGPTGIKVYQSTAPITSVTYDSASDKLTIVTSGSGSLLLTMLEGKPREVILDGTSQPEGSTWSYDTTSTILTLTGGSTWEIIWRAYRVSTDNTTYAQLESIQFTGTGFTPGGSVQSCISTGDVAGVGPCVSQPNADSNGNVAGSMQVGTNIPTGPQKFWVVDLSTSTDSNAVQLTITEAQYQVTFNTNPTSFVGSGGTITFSGSTYPNGQSGSYSAGDYSATANAPSGYRFEFWTYSGSSGSGVYVPNISLNPTIVQVHGSGWLKAVFSAQVTFYTSPSDQGSISWGSCSNPGKTNGQTTYDASLPLDYDNSITACANVPTGYTFSGWSCSDGLSCSGSSTSTTVTFAGPGSITVTFSQTAEISMSVSYSVVGGGSPSAPVFNYVLNGAASSLTLSETSTSVLVDAGSTWSVTPNPLSGSSTKQRWYSSQPLRGTASSTTIVFVFSLQYRLTMSVNPSGGGTVTPASGWQSPGASVSIQATPNVNYAFLSWTGSGTGSYSGTSNPGSVTMNGPITEKARFQQTGGRSSVSLVSPKNGATVTSSPVTLSVTVAGFAQGATVTVFVDASQVCSGSTNSNGSFSCKVTVASGTHSWYAVAAKTDFTSGTSPTWTFTY